MIAMTVPKVLIFLGGIPLIMVIMIFVIFSFIVGFYRDGFSDWMYKYEIPESDSKIGRFKSEFKGMIDGKWTHNVDYKTVSLSTVRETK